MKFEVQGVYVKHTINPLPSGPYAGKLAGDLILQVDNSYTKKDGTKVPKLTEVPFGCFDRTASKVRDEIEPGERLVVTFNLEGYYSDKTGKYYSKNKAVFVNRASDLHQGNVGGGGGRFGGPPPSVYDHSGMDNSDDMPF